MYLFLHPPSTGLQKELTTTTSLNPADSTVAVVIYPPVVCTILPRMQMFEKGRKSKQR